MNTLSCVFLFSIGIFMISACKAAPYGQENTPIAEPTPTPAVNDRDAPLYCFLCNGNQKACSHPADLTKLKDHLVPCNGQCIKYQNPYDNNVWYRGCSWEMDFMERQDPVVNRKGITYYFCEVNGCNAF